MQRIKAVLCTADAFRHKFVASKLSEFNIDLLVIHEATPFISDDNHFNIREQVECEFFENEIRDDYLSYYVPRGAVNTTEVQELINQHQPSAFISYGCSIITDATMANIKCAKINTHLGLSPYYRGTATNFWPMYNNEMQYCGVTFHELTSKIDGGSILHQFAVEKASYETVHHVGNSLIKRVPEELLKVLKNPILPLDQKNEYFPEKPRYYYKNSDYTFEKSCDLNRRFVEILDTFINNSAPPSLPT